MVVVGLLSVVLVGFVILVTGILVVVCTLLLGYAGTCPPTSHPIAMILFSFCLGFVVPETQVWKDWNNPWKGPLDADCNEGILTGISSYHNNGQEDRKWKIQCSEVS